MNVTRLVKKAQKGNNKALLKLISAEQSDYYRLAFSYVMNEHDAKDAMSEMIVTLYEKIPNLKKPTAFYSWSKTILVNHCKDLLQDRKNIVPIEKPLDNARLRHDDNILMVEMESLLSKLSDDHKDAIILKYFHDYTYDMIAGMMDISVGTAKSRVYYAMEKLRENERRIENESH